jgi:pyruvate dehydrogenase E2 component (dihydrolipoamide acetyltransferase)
MSLTLSADHRAVDGATAAEFLRTVRRLLEEPGMMLV